MSKVHVSFTLNKLPKNGGRTQYATVRAYMSNHGDKVFYTTPFTTPVSNWKPKTSRTPDAFRHHWSDHRGRRWNAADANDELTRIRNVMEHVATHVFKGDLSNTKAVRTEIDIHLGKKKRTLTSSSDAGAPYMDDGGAFVISDGAKTTVTRGNIKQGEPLSKSTRRRYHAAKRAWLEYERHIGHRIHFTDYAEHMERFDGWLVTNDASHNTRADYIGDVYRIVRRYYQRIPKSDEALRDAIVRVLNKDDRYRVGKIKTKQPALTQSQLKRLMSVDLSPDAVARNTKRDHKTNGRRAHNMSDIVARKQSAKYRAVLDAFVIGCLTSLRVSEYTALRPENLVQRNGRHMFHITTRKNRKDLLIPAYDTTLDILNRYDGWNIPATDAQIRKHIKTIARWAGLDDAVATTTMDDDGRPDHSTTAPLWSRIGTHTGRRTALTYWYDNRAEMQLTTDDLMLISGHADLVTFLMYIDRDKDDAKETTVGAVMDFGSIV